MKTKLGPTRQYYHMVDEPIWGNVFAHYFFNLKVHVPLFKKLF